MFVTDELASMYPICAACGKGITAEEIASFDWVADKLVHRGDTKNGCVPLYITQYIIANPSISIRQTMMVWALGRTSVMRFRKRAREVYYGN